MSTTSKLRAGQMSFVLIGILVVLLCILIGGSILASNFLFHKSSDATHAKIDADISASYTTRLAALKQYLAKNASGISETQTLTAGLGKYDQTSIVAALSTYAAKSGITIASFDFGTGTATLPGVAATAAGTVNITLGAPVSYPKFILFLRLLEQGLMPAEVKSAQITGDPVNPGDITVSALTIQVAQ